MVAIPFPNQSTPGYRPQESAGRLINCFAEQLGEGRREFKIVRVPGLTSFLTSAHGADSFRGMMLVGGTLYAAFKGAVPASGGDLMTGTSAGGAMTAFATGHAALAGTGRVYFARNNKVPTPDKVMVTENGAFIIAATISSYPDVDLPAPNGVCMLDGYFVFTIGDGRLFASDLNNTSVNQLSFGTTDVKPDTPVRPIPYAGRLLVFGTQSLEIWTDVGAQPFPFQRATTVPFGLIGPDAVAGWEDGWGAGLLWVADDGTGRILDGYTPVKVSTPDLDRLIAREPNKSALMANVHMVDGHPMWTITGTNFSWSFDLNSKKWHERASYLTDRWRGLQTARAFNRWLIGDRKTGNIYDIDPTNHREGGDPLPMRIESAAVEKFPQRVRVARADFHLKTGVGIATGLDPIEIDPTVGVSWSDDGGMNWSVPLLRKMGRQAADVDISVFGTGMSSRHGRRWRLDLPDPVYVALFGGDQAAELRAP